METKMRKLIVGLCMVVMMIIFNGCFPGELPQPPEYTNNMTPVLEKISPDPEVLHLLSKDKTLIFSADASDYNIGDTLHIYWYKKELESEEDPIDIFGYSVTLDSENNTGVHKVSYEVNDKNFSRESCGRHMIILKISDRGFAKNRWDTPDPDAYDAVNGKSITQTWILSNGIGEECQK